MKTPTVNLFFDTRTQKKTGLYPVKLTIYFNGDKKRYHTNIDLTPTQWDKINGQNLRDESLKDFKYSLNSLVDKANKHIEELHVFSFQGFEKLFFSNTNDKHSVFDAFKNYIDKLTEDGRVNTASSYRCSNFSLRKFSNKEKLMFADITPEFLKSYEKWMLSNGNTTTTIGIYLRCLRALYNQLIIDAPNYRQLYPFGRNKYQIPLGRNIKKALELQEIEKIYNYQPIQWTNEDKAKDFWLFSYLCNGINCVDIANLKFKNINGERIIFIREKTKNTIRNNSKPIVVILTDDIKQIIKKWANKPTNPDEYVFPILQHNLTPIQKLTKIQIFTKTINVNIKKIAIKCNIEKNISTYTARHSFSTILKRSGAPIEFISESLGHTDLKTTENYLDSFEDHYKKEWATKLTAFKTNI